MGSPIRIRCATSRGRTRHTGRRGYVAVRSPGAARSVPAIIPARLLRGFECVRLLSWCGGSLISLDSAIFLDSHFRIPILCIFASRRRPARGGYPSSLPATLNARRCGSGSSDSDRTGRRATIMDQADHRRSGPELSIRRRVGLAGRGGGRRACPLLPHLLPGTPNTRVDARHRLTRPLGETP